MSDRTQTLSVERYRLDLTDNAGGPAPILQKHPKGHVVLYDDVVAALSRLLAQAPPPPDSQGEQEECECGGSGQIPTGECREAMSGPTCGNPNCPPCQTPETDRCPDCGPASTQGEGTTPEQRKAAIDRATEKVRSDNSGFLRRVAQADPGGEEDWPEVVLYRSNPGAPPSSIAKKPVEPNGVTLQRYTPKGEGINGSD